MPKTLEPLDIEGATLWSFGDGSDAPLVIALADLTASGRWFADLAATCGDLVRLVAPDLASPPRPLQVSQMARAVHIVAATAERFSSGRIILIGHGTGAQLAVAVASQMPELLDAVVLLDGPPVLPPGDDPVEVAMRIDPGASRVRQTFATRDAAIAAGVATGRLPRAGMSRTLRQAVDAETYGSGFGWRSRLDEAAVIEWIQALREHVPRRNDGVEIVALRAASGHLVDDVPLELAEQPDEVTTLACTHAGLLWDSEALKTIAATVTGLAGR